VKTKRVEHIEQLQLYINTLALGNENKPCHWKYPIKNGDKVGDASFTDGQAKLIEKKVEGTIKKALPLEESWVTDWTEVCKRLMRILRTLTQLEDFTDSKIALVGL
jgi:hypothetical protein